MGQGTTGTTPKVQLPRDETVYILSREEALSAWLSDQVRKGKLRAGEARQLWNQWNKVPSAAANYFATATDVVLFARLARDLGSPGTKFYVKDYGGKLHIVLKGSPGMRTILTGTKYGVAHPKVVNMGLGRLGAMKSIRGGGIVTLVLVSAYNIINFVMSDTMKMSELIGSLAVDVAKVAASTAIAAGFVSLTYGGAAIGASLALGPLAVAIVIGIGAGLALDYLDNRYQLKQRLSTMLADVADQVEQRIEQAREGVLDAGRRIIATAIDLVVDELGRQFRRYVSDTLNDLRWFVMPRL